MQWDEKERSLIAWFKCFAVALVNNIVVADKKSFPFKQLLKEQNQSWDTIMIKPIAESLFVVGTLRMAIEQTKNESKLWFPCASGFVYNFGEFGASSLNSEAVSRHCFCYWWQPR